MALVLSRLLVTGLAALASLVSAAPLNEPIKPIPPVSRQDPARAEIGRRLFHDGRLSANGKMSCATCHPLAKGGTDGLVRSSGFDGKPLAINTPTVFNAALNFKQFWDGRVDSLEAQIEAVVANPVEMGATWPDVVAKVGADPTYRQAFAAAYPDGVTKANIQSAIATYERTLVTPNSRFDRFLGGEATALSDEEKSGYAKFKQYGCVACHQGVNVGGNMFQKFGVMGDISRRSKAPTDADLGRFQVTKLEADRFVFKVPSLRNVALTAPYLHDGTAKTLEDAVDVMFRYQLGRTAPKGDKQEIVKFLNTLTGDLAPRP